MSTLAPPPPGAPAPAVLAAVAPQGPDVAGHRPVAPDARPGVVADPLPLPRAGWGAADALAALEEARLVLPVAPDEPEVVSVLTTVVLRLGDDAVKVYPPGTDAAHLGAVATALDGSRRGLLPRQAPVVTSSGVVVVSPWLADARPARWPRIGRALRRFHDDHTDADVPAWVPLRRLDGLLDALPDDAAAVLLDARAALLDAVASAGTELGTGAVHGDVSPGNVLRSRGRTWLVDLDFVARGPLEYDLTSAARRFDAGELDDVTYLRFCRAYGHDVRGWAGRPVLDAVAELGGVLFRLWDDRQRGVGSPWLGAAVGRWRTPL
ncbi:phosphotransferase [Cellulomonas fimi]|uniref:Aminoglycoside phosphotransferase n=1 Tax=Cellulomonas fimi (strain ATCC 484 / DSM 20113 / JCM 1341 / CCUG 24087 / LMG 16345 / NBRC 15513 / NCIMB 8980 / NCTC 7547 / NRS-133) TaxID=590998 RepID=F4H029_CELFA|nr:phosphotransferase [Cellulomonas fimi]AEE44951.1 aminoglycoside phosphotransferase [Cellulomonas fimi ATCC 484]NNH07226.1 phosphotransferase [Cellulomonas fimi]